MLEFAWPVPQIPHLSLVGSEEAFFYLNKSVWGDSGFTENRAYLGLGYAFTTYFTGSLGYLHQYIVHDNGDDSSNHTLSLNLGFTYGSSIHSLSVAESGHRKRPAGARRAKPPPAPTSDGLALQKIPAANHSRLPRKRMTSRASKARKLS